MTAAADLGDCAYAPLVGTNVCRLCGHSDECHASADPFIAWLATLPVGPPLSELARARLAEAEKRIASGKHGRSMAHVAAAWGLERMREQDKKEADG